MGRASGAAADLAGPPGGPTAPVAMRPCSKPAELLSSQARHAVELAAVGPDRLLITGSVPCRVGDRMQVQVNLPASHEATVFGVKVVSTSGAVDGLMELALHDPGVDAVWALHHLLACLDAGVDLEQLGPVRAVAPRIRIRGDGQLAHADLEAPPAPMGSQQATEAVVACLRAAGVVHGFRRDRIEAALRRASEGGGLQVRVPVALATPAQPERSPEVRFLFSVGGREAGELGPEARASMAEAGLLALDFVREGDVVCVRSPRRAAVPGSDVRGAALRPGRPERAETTRVQLGEGVQADPDRPERIACTLPGGYADYDGRSVKVLPALTVSEDSMRVELSVHPPQDAAALPLELEDLDLLLQAEGIVHGVDRAAAAALIAAALLKPTVGRPFAVARGTDPCHGRDAHLRRRDRPAGQGAGRVDSPLVFRCEADERFDRVAATRGVTGMDVRGATVAALDGIDHRFTAGPGVRVEGVAFVPTLPGVMCAMSGQLSAFPLRSLRPQDGALTAPEHAIRIAEGAVASPQAEAAGPIVSEQALSMPRLGTATHAVLGGAVDGQGAGWVRADGGIWIASATDLELRAGQDLFVFGDARDCRISVGGCLHMPEGALSGGEAYAACGIEVGELGTAEGRVTELRIGPRPGRGIGADLDREQQVRQRLQRIFARIGGRRLADLRPEQRARFAELVTERDLLKRELDQLAADPERRHRALRGDGEIVVRRRLYPGVTVRIRSQSYKCLVETGPCRIAMNRATGRIALTKR